MFTAHKWETLSTEFGYAWKWKIDKKRVICFIIKIMNWRYYELKIINHINYSGKCFLNENAQKIITSIKQLTQYFHNAYFRCAAYLQEKRETIIVLRDDVKITALELYA